MGMKIGNNILKIVILIVLYFFLVSLALVTITIPIGTIYSLIKSTIKMTGVFYMLVQFVYYLNYLLVVKMLIGIIKSTWETPFIIKNVKRFKVMACCLTVNVIFECIIGYGANKYSNIQLFSNGKGAISPMMAIGIIAALMCFVMAEVFKKAVEIKNDNDLTI
ncbi:MAG: DUF2975 domain-containing protein [Clostridium sp.]